MIAVQNNVDKGEARRLLGPEKCKANQLQLLPGINKSQTFSFFFSREFSYPNF